MVKFVPFKLILKIFSNKTIYNLNCLLCNCLVGSGDYGEYCGTFKECKGFR